MACVACEKDRVDIVTASFHEGKSGCFGMQLIASRIHLLDAFVNG